MHQNNFGQEQWTDHITLQELQWKWGDDATTPEMVARIT